jgi:hypothetical protein
VTEPAGLFLLLPTVATAALVVAGTAVCLLVPVSAAQARAEAPFCSRLSRPPAVPGYRYRRLPPCGSAAEPVSTYQLVRLGVVT